MNSISNDSAIDFSVELADRGPDKIYLSPEHSHKYHELYYLIEGDAKYFINNTIINVHENEIAFVKMNHIHKATYDYGRPSKRILINFTSEYIGEEYINMLNEFGHRKLLRVDSVTRTEAAELFRKIHTEYTAKKPHYLSQCKNLLRELVIILYRQPAVSSSEKLSENEIIIQNAAKYISSHLSEDISLHALADICAMSESHFSRTFKQYTGLGVSKYIKLSRLRYAEKLLVSGEYSITEIAMKCGFNNSNYFISEFKKHKGITPFKYSIINRLN